MSGRILIRAGPAVPELGVCLLVGNHIRGPPALFQFSSSNPLYKFCYKSAHRCDPQAGHRAADCRRKVTPLPHGELLAVMASNSEEIPHIHGLGFIGLLASRAQHQPHHPAVPRARSFITTEPAGSGGGLDPLPGRSLCVVTHGQVHRRRRLVISDSGVGRPLRACSEFWQCGFFRCARALADGTDECCRATNTIVTRFYDILS